MVPLKHTIETFHFFTCEFFLRLPSNPFSLKFLVLLAQALHVTFGGKQSCAKELTAARRKILCKSKFNRRYNESPPLPTVNSGSSTYAEVAYTLKLYDTDLCRRNH